MALDEDIEPVCVEGIEPEAAVERAYENFLFSKKDYMIYRFGRYIMPAYAGIVGFSLSIAAPITIVCAAAGLAALIINERKCIRASENYAIAVLQRDYLQKTQQVVK